MAETRSDLKQLRVLIDEQRNYDQAIRLLASRKPADLNGEEFYLYGFCLLQGDRDLPRAIEYLGRAEERGFSKYWIWIHRAPACLKVGQISEALVDASAAVALNATPEAEQLLEKIIEAALARVDDKDPLVGTLFKTLMDLQKRAAKYHQLSQRKIVREDYGDFQAFVYADDAARGFVAVEPKCSGRPHNSAQSFVAQYRPGQNVLRLLVCHHLIHDLQPAFFDIGANVGDEAIRMALFLRPLGQVVPIFAFEPGIMRHLLPHTLRLNRLEHLVTFEPVAMWREEEPIIMYEEPGNSEDNRLVGTSISSRTSCYISEATSFDLYRQHHNLSGSSVISMDTQGAEPFVVAGMGRSLRESLVSMVCEFAPHAIATHTDPARFLLGLIGTHLVYDLTTSRNRLIPVPAEGVAELIDRVSAQATPWTDLLCLPRGLPGRESLEQKLRPAVA